MRPKYFDVLTYGKDYSEVPVVRPWRTIQVDPSRAGQWIVAGDLDGDGEVELVSARNNPDRPSQEVVSVITHKLDGTVLWEWGEPQAGVARLGYDVACQVYDWDGDGDLEVVVVGTRDIVELDGATGAEKRRLPVPEDAADCLTFVNLSGGERATDVLIKTRYEQIWALDSEGRERWNVRHPAGRLTAHQVFPVDLDGDGRDELIVGYAMLNADGSMRWEMEAARELPLGIGCHLDCARVLRRGETAADWRFVVTCCANERMASVDGTGRTVWVKDNRHYESVDVCSIYPELPGKQIVVDVAKHEEVVAPIHVLDEDGALLGKLFTWNSRFHFPIDWDGSGRDLFVVGGEHALFDGRGDKIASFDTPGIDNPSGLICGRGDLTGNGVPDVMISADHGGTIFLYRNEHGAMSAPGLPEITEVNYTLY